MRDTVSKSMEPRSVPSAELADLRAVAPPRWDVACAHFHTWVVSGEAWYKPSPLRDVRAACLLLARLAGGGHRDAVAAAGAGARLLELLREAFELGVDAKAGSGLLDQASGALWGKACNTLRAAPWLLESLPAKYAKHPGFQDAVLSGWHDYLEVAPWLLPHLPAAWGAHFEKTRSGVNRIVPPPAEEVQSPLRAVA
jgi:hypothetical protein